MDFKNASLLRIFLNEKNTFKGKPLYEQIVLQANELKLAGATVLRGILGFGAGHHLHSAKILTLSEDMPVVVEIVDSEENINKLLPFLKKEASEGIVTLEKVKVFS
ncbi:MAG: DUF190 domain-containing protein [Spirochaetes bacterium]|nr:DUF190 domain-containing protein [Spirochaetota bacterium]